MELLEVEAVAHCVASEIPRVQPAAVGLIDSIEEEVDDDAELWDEIGGPEVPIYQEVVDQSKLARDR